MKSYRELEKQLLSSSESISLGFSVILKNIGQAVAFITAAVAVIITFTEVAFSALTPQELLPSALALLVCSYIIYFSLEDAGERLGEESHEYLEARERFIKAKSRLSGDDAEAFRTYLEEYSIKELDARRRGALLAAGITSSELAEYKSMDKSARKSLPPEKRRAMEKLSALKPTALTPAMIFSEERGVCSSGLESPEKGKLIKLILKILPSTLCMFVTISVALNIKADMNATDVLNGILKLTALPLVGFRGYSLGYIYAKNTLSGWLCRKAEIIESFLSERSKNNTDTPDRAKAEANFH